LNTRKWILEKEKPKKRDFVQMLLEVSYRISCKPSPMEVSPDSHFSYEIQDRKSMAFDCCTGFSLTRSVAAVKDFYEWIVWQVNKFDIDALTHCIYYRYMNSRYLLTGGFTKSL
jgi:hypothetical protein